MVNADIPKEWVVKTIAQLGNYNPATVQTGPFGAQLHSSDYVDEGVPFILIKNLQDGGLDTTDMPHITYRDAHRLSLYALQTGDVVFSRVGRVGSCFLVETEQEGWMISGQMLRIRLPSDAIDRHYLIHALRSKPAQDRITGVSVGSTRQSINTQILESLKVLVPSFPEQRRIAEILDAADDAIRQTERVIAKLRQVKAGLLHDLLTRGLDAQGRLRDPVAHPEQFKDSPLGRIPREWEVKHLTEELSFPTGQVDPKQEPYRGWPLIAPDHIESVTGRLLAIQTAAEQNAISGKYAFEPGDVLYSKIRPYLRKAVLADCVGLCSADMYPLRPSSGLDSRFLLALILGEDFSRFASAVSMRSGFPKINREEFGEYETVLPPFEEQRCIAATLDAADARIRAEEATLAKLRQVKRGLMDDLLTGRVRVL